MPPPVPLLLAEDTTIGAPSRPFSHCIELPQTQRTCSIDLSRAERAEVGHFISPLAVALVRCRRATGHARANRFEGNSDGLRGSRWGSSGSIAPPVVRRHGT